MDSNHGQWHKKSSLLFNYKNTNHHHLKITPINTMYLLLFQPHQTFFIMEISVPIGHLFSITHINRLISSNTLHIKHNNHLLITYLVNVSWRQWHPTPVLLPGKSHGRRSLVGCSPWGLWVRHDWVTSLSLSCLGEGNGNPLQYSCLGEPGGLPSMGSHRVWHDWSDLAAAVNVS